MTAKADEGPRMLEDVWIQVLLIFTVISGLFCVNFFLDSLRVRVDGPSNSQASDPGSRPAPRGRGRIAEVQSSADGGTPTLTALLSAANDGDVIALKPGVYNESLTIAKSVTISGAGSSPDDVLLESAEPQTLAVSRGSVALKNLSISNKGSANDEAVHLSGGALSMSKVRVRASGQAIRIVGGDLTAEDSLFESRAGIAGGGNTKIRIVRSKVHTTDSAVTAAGLGVDLRLEDVEIRSARGSAVEANRFSKVKMTEAALSRNGSGAVDARGGAEVSIRHSDITDNRDCGVVVDGAILYLERVHFARNRCGIGFLGPGSAQVVDSSFSEEPAGAVEVKPGFEKKVVLRGSGNSGMETGAR